MDFLFDDSREDKLIEDYLFSGYRLGSKCSNKDQQFAKPIEDEDLFGIGDADDYNQNNNSIQNENNETTSRLEEISGDNDTKTNEDDEEDFPIGGGSDILCERNINSLDLFGGEIIEQDDGNLADTEKNKSSTSMNERSELDDIDDIFTDDYSKSPEPLANRLQTGYSRTKSNDLQNNEKSNTNPQPATLTPAQIKRKQLKEKLLAQARAMSAKPRKLGTGFDEDGTIELTIEHNRLVSNSDSKFIFNKLFNNSKKANDNLNSPDNNQKKSWIALKQSLRKKISSQRRKIWDSFQNPVDDYDEEEEIVGISTDENDTKVDNNDNSNDVDPFEVEQGGDSEENGEEEEEENNDFEEEEEENDQDEDQEEDDDEEQEETREEDDDDDIDLFA